MEKYPKWIVELGHESEDDLVEDDLVEDDLVEDDLVEDDLVEDDPDTGPIETEIINSDDDVL